MKEDKFLRFCNRWGYYTHKDLGLTPKQMKRSVATQATILFLIIAIPLAMTIGWLLEHTQ